MKTTNNSGNIAMKRSAAWSHSWSIDLIQCFADALGITVPQGDNALLEASEVWTKQYASPEYQLAGFVKKNTHLKHSEWDPEKRAINTFLYTEERCKRYNRYLRRNTVRGRIGQEMQNLLHRLAFTLQRWLGEYPGIDEPYISGGATRELGKRDANLYNKLASAWEINPMAMSTMFEALKKDSHLLECLSPDDMGFLPGSENVLMEMFVGRVVPCMNNKIESVPKTAKTHRVIAKEPLLSMYCQLGHGNLLRKRLRATGMPVDDEAVTLNRERALTGSISGEWATIDLTSASDLLSTGLIRAVLPAEWFDALRDCRSPNYHNDRLGLSGRYEKFCTSGNGFTFPLQTLIFSALCYVSGAGRPGRDYSVFGDDIIVRTEHYHAVIRNLWKIGAIPNPSKCFSVGSFRESCGCDYHNGNNVRPMFVTSLEDVRDLISIGNKALCKTEDPTVPAHTRHAYRCVYELILESKTIGLTMGLFPSSESSALRVDVETLMRFGKGRWCGALCTWQWEEHLSKPNDAKIDSTTRLYPTALRMTALRGGSAAHPFPVNGKDRTRLRWVPPSPKVALQR